MRESRKLWSDIRGEINRYIERRGVIFLHCYIDIYEPVMKIFEALSRKTT